MSVSAHNAMPVILAAIQERINSVRFTKNTGRNGLLMLRSRGLRWARFVHYVGREMRQAFERELTILSVSHCGQ